jgi:hypothetical protein
MAVLHGCLTCRVEMESVALADGSAVLVCVTCDTIGVTSEAGIGGRRWPAGMTAISRREPPMMAARGIGQGTSVAITELAEAGLNKT